MMDRTKVVSLLRPLSYLPNSDLVEELEDYYYELLMGLEEEDVKAIVKNILHNEDYFPSVKRFREYVRDYKFTYKRKQTYYSRCSECNKIFAFEKEVNNIDCPVCKQGKLLYVGRV